MATRHLQIINILLLQQEQEHLLNTLTMQPPKAQ
jgi:hypothetical protein